MSLFEQILAARGLTGEARTQFLKPDYAKGHDPFLLPDMQKAVERLVVAREKQQKITIYGDYDIDGLTAATVLLDALESFGFRFLKAYIPNRFVEGYGLTVEAVEAIAKSGAELIITVDCGSLSTKEITRAGELGVDVIVTDHHNVLKLQPPAVAVINPKRLLDEFPKKYENYVLKTAQKNLYPFVDLPGVGVAFKLVQALQTRLDGLAAGQEKWLLDLVALGTVCDVVTLQNENRMHVHYGLKVLQKTRRPGLKALLAVAGADPQQVTARTCGFQLGPRMNAAGRLETAQYALEMLRAREGMVALDKAQQLDAMNMERRKEQDRIFKEAIVEAEKYTHDSVLVVSGKNWSHGIIGIVAAKLLEKYKKPTFVLEEDVNAQHKAVAELQGEGQDSELISESKRRGEPLLSKGSARSYGDFSAADAIRASDDIITKGGGHKLAAGVTLPTNNIAAFRLRVNEYYQSLGLKDQAQKLLPKADVAIADLQQLTEGLVQQLAQLEPFGNGNPEPVLRLSGALVTNLRRMGSEGQHVKLQVQDANGRSIELLAFSAPQHWFIEPGECVDVWFEPTINDWNGKKTVEGRLVNVMIVA